MAEKLITLSNLQRYDENIKDYVGKVTKIVSIKGCELVKGEGEVYSGTITGYSNNGDEISAEISFDASDFVKDSFLSDAKIVEREIEGVTHQILVLSFITVDEGGRKELEDIEVDLTKFVDIYTGDDTTINVNNKQISAKTSAVAKDAESGEYEAETETALVTAGTVAAVAQELAEAIGDVPALQDGTVILSEDASDHTLVASTTKKESYDLTLVVATDDEIDAMFVPKATEEEPLQ